MSARVEVLQDWAAFLSYAEKLDIGSTFQSAYYYRGQARADWDSLRPSLLRKFLRAGDIAPAAAIRIERVILAEFQAKAYRHLPSTLFSGEISLPGWWSLMQHHHVPTRFLDWTRSPYVAAYFAVETEPDEDGAVWAVHPRSVRDAMERAFPGAPDPESELSDDTDLYLNPDGLKDLRFVRPTRETDRMSSQQTIFSVSRWVLSDHGEILAAAVNQRDPELRFAKLVIPHAQKPLFLRRLSRMNITADSLFPGIDGLGRSLAEWVGRAAFDALQSGALEAPPPRA